MIFSLKKNVTILVLLSIVVLVAAQPPKPADDPTCVPKKTARAGKANICHGTASDSNPYVLISIDESALKAHFDGSGKGHGARNHPDIWPNSVGWDGRKYDCNCAPIVDQAVAKASIEVALGDSEGCKEDQFCKIGIIVTVESCVGSVCQPCASASAKAVATGIPSGSQLSTGWYPAGSALSGMYANDNAVGMPMLEFKTPLDFNGLLDVELQVPECSCTTAAGATVTSNGAETASFQKLIVAVNDAPVARSSVAEVEAYHGETADVGGFSATDVDASFETGAGRFCVQAAVGALAFECVDCPTLKFYNHHASSIDGVFKGDYNPPVTVVGGEEFRAACFQSGPEATKALAMLRYVNGGWAGHEDGDTVTFTAFDEGNTGLGGGLTGTASVKVKTPCNLCTINPETNMPRLNGVDVTDSVACATATQLHNGFPNGGPNHDKTKYVKANQYLVCKDPAGEGKGQESFLDNVAKNAMGSTQFFWPTTRGTGCGCRGYRAPVGADDFKGTTASSLVSSTIGDDKEAGAQRDGSMNQSQEASSSGVTGVLAVAAVAACGAMVAAGFVVFRKKNRSPVSNIESGRSSATPNMSYRADDETDGELSMSLTAARAAKLEKVTQPTEVVEFNHSLSDAQAAAVDRLASASLKNFGAPRRGGSTEE
jgi:hypothetical protein